MSGGVLRRVEVRGRVQGVGFRAFVAAEAARRRLEGWVRNRRDGSVEAVFAGADDVVTAMIDACRRGPLGSRVEALDERDAADGDLDLRRPGERFSTLPTAYVAAPDCRGCEI